jgi:hypothetical protein
VLHGRFQLCSAVSYIRQGEADNMPPITSLPPGIGLRYGRLSISEDSIYVTEGTGRGNSAERLEYNKMGNSSVWAITD